MPPGEGQAITYSAFSSSTQYFDDHGHLEPLSDYKKFELGTYIEYGLTDALTLVAAPGYDVIRQPAACSANGDFIPGQSYTGPAESGLAARVGLFHSDNAVVSVQAGVLSPGGSLANVISPFLIHRTTSFDMRAMAGRSGLFLGMEAFAEIEGGYRAFTGGQPGEWHFDLTGGVRPLLQFLVMLQSFTTISNGSGWYSHYSWTKLQPSVVVDLTPQWAFQIGGFITVSGVNAGREIGPFVGIWYRF